MRQDERLYKAYLEEIHALETFKIANGGLYKGVFDELSEDPHTKRLIETLAFFMARNKIHGEQRIVQFYQRLFREYFPFLSNPLPSMGMIAIHPSLDLPEKIQLKEGSEIAFLTGEGRRAYFQTLAPVTLLPIQLHKFNLAPADGGLRASFQFQARAMRGEQIGEFKLYINHLGYLPSSLSLKLALQSLLERIEVSYATGEPSELRGEVCPFSFEEVRSSTLLSHPVEEVSSRLHLPEQEQFIKIQLPPHNGRWRAFTLIVFIKESWPKELILTRDSLIPFVTPIVNLKRQVAEPIRVDGTKDSYPILHPQPDDEFVMQSHLGVYETQHGHVVPIKPGVLTHEKGTYDIESLDPFGLPRYRILFNFKDVLHHPKLISVDALWTQPWFSNYLDKEIKPKLINQSISGLDLRLIGKLAPYEHQAASYDMAYFARVLALKNRFELDLEEVFFLFDRLKRGGQSYFREIPGLTKELKIIKIPNTLSSATTSMEYHFRLEEWDGKNWELVVLYFKHLRTFLNSWLVNSEIEVKVSSSRIKNEIILKNGQDHEISALARTFFLSQ